MIDVAVIGGPSLPRAWVEELLREAAAASDTAPNILPLDFASAAPSDLGARPNERRPYLMMVKEPPAWLLELITARRVRAIAILEDPLDAVAYSRGLKGCTLLEGVRDQSAAMTAALALRNNASVTLISRHLPIDAREIAAELLQCVGWSIGIADRERLLQSFGGSRERPWSIEEALAAKVPHYTQQCRETVDYTRDEEAVAVTQALDPLIMLAVGVDVRPVIWPTTLLLDGDDFVRAAQTTVDLTGPARNLVRGPYLCLPPARYACRYVMNFDELAAQTRFALEIHGKRLLAEFRFSPASPGTMALDFEVEIDGPDHWIDMRFRLAEGTIEGRASAVQAEWRLQPEVR